MISYIGSALFSRKDLKNIVPDLFVKAFEIIELPRELKHHPFVNRIKRSGIPLAKKKMDSFSVVALARLLNNQASAV